MARDDWEIYSYVAAGISSVVITLAAWQVSPLLGSTSLYLLFVLAVTLNAWLGGLKTGLIVTAVATVASFFFFIFTHPSGSRLFLVSTFETTMFTLLGILISFVIEKYKKTDLVASYRKKNKEYVKNFNKLEEESLKMKEEIRLRDEFLSIASHELKTPLTSMLLKLQMILHNIRNVSLANFSVEKLLKNVETAEEQTKRLSRMINDLLNVSLITTGKLNLEPAEEDLTEVVKEVVNEFSEKLEKGGYTLKLNANLPIPMIVDKLRISQVISNMISNAIKYGESKPIDVLVTRINGSAQIVVRDNGFGIDPEQQMKIFHLFERGTPKNGTKGLGVGLYIANQIVRAHGGTISVQSKPQQGSLFTIDLPVDNKLHPLH